jgi:RNA polymerase sigma-70 factor (ECF subfamily)
VTKRAANVLPFPDRLEMTDALLSGLAARDPEAITRVYRHHHGRVRAYARRMLGDDAAAEDVVHDVFVALPDAISRFRGDAALGTFLMSIAVNLCRRRVRSSARGRRAVERMKARKVESEVPTPEEETRARRLAAALSRGLATLSVEHREVFILAAVEERTSREVADILDVAPGTVRTRLFHARKSLRAFLEREGVR